MFNLSIILFILLLFFASAVLFWVVRHAVRYFLWIIEISLSILVVGIALFFVLLPILFPTQNLIFKEWWDMFLYLSKWGWWIPGKLFGLLKP